MRILSFTCKTMVFFVTVSAVFWAVPPQAADGKQESKQFGVFSDHTGELACFTLSRGGKETKWLPPDFDGWFRFGDEITMKNQNNCGTASITILLAGNKVTVVEKLKNKMAIASSGSPSEPMKVVLDGELEKLATSRSGSGTTETRGEECITGTQYLVGGKAGIETISLLADKDGCPKSNSQTADLQEMSSCENGKTKGKSVPLKLSTKLMGKGKWLVLEKKDSGPMMMEGNCYQLSITGSPIKIEVVASGGEKKPTQIYQWPPQGK